MVELSAVLINRCLVGHDGKTPYSRSMVKNSSKELVEFGERVLAKVTQCHTSTRKQALMSRWEDAIWVGVAKKSIEQIVVREVEDQQSGVGLSSGGRSQADGVPKKVAERKPCPETSERGSVDAEKEIRVATSGAAEGMPQPMTQEPPKPKKA